MRLFPLTAHQSDAESLAHGEGRERAVLVDALEQVQPLEQRVGALVREVVRRGHAEHLRLEPREVLAAQRGSLPRLGQKGIPPKAGVACARSGRALDGQV